MTTFPTKHQPTGLTPNRPSLAREDSVTGNLPTGSSSVELELGGGGEGYERSIACGAAPEGQCVVTTTSGSAPLAPNAFASMTQCVADASPLAGKRVRLSGRLRTDQVEGFAGVWLRVDPPDRDGRPPAFDNMAHNSWTARRTGVVTA